MNSAAGSFSTRKNTVTALQFKVILVGDSMVGKTSIIQRYIDDMYIENNGTAPTLAWDFKIKNLILPKHQDQDQPEESKDGEKVRLYVWDTAGQERFRHIARIYYKDVHGVLVVFDLSDEESFKNLNFWLSDLNKHAPEKLVKVLVGNKVDLTKASEERSRKRESFENKREVSYEMAQNFALENQMYYLECSAKTGENINDAFRKVAEEIMAERQRNIEMDLPITSRKSSALDAALHFGKKETYDRP